MYSIGYSNDIKAWAPSGALCKNMHIIIYSKLVSFSKRLQMINELSEYRIEIYILKWRET